MTFMTKKMWIGLKDEGDGKEPCNNKYTTTTSMTKRMIIGSHDKDDSKECHSKEKNRMMMIKKMRNESKLESDGEDSTTTKKRIQWWPWKWEENHNTNVRVKLLQQQ